MHASITGTFCAISPQAASSAMAISKSFRRRISHDFSSLSVSCPLVAENSRNGRMNSAPITSPAMAGGNQPTLSW